MFASIKKYVKQFESYVWGVKLLSFNSKLNGKLELWLIDNKQVLNSANANQSYDSLHRVFQKVFTQIHLKEKNINSILLLGLGCGSVPTIVFDELKMNSKIIAVEHDELMLQIANNHFKINRFKNLEVKVMDALEYVNSSSQKFDLIIVDLFTDDEVPQKFTETDFIETLKKLCHSNGILLFNMIVNNKIKVEQFEKLFHQFKDAIYIEVDLTNRVIVYLS
jgi:spermidine synthase